MITAKDCYSDVIKTLKGSTQSFGKDVEGLQSKLKALGGTKATLKVEVDEAKRALKSAEEAYKSCANEGTKAVLKMASANYDQVKRNFAAVSKEIRQTERDLTSLATEGGKAMNRAGGICGAVNDLRNSPAGSQLVGMVGNSLAGMGGAMINSALGDTAGNAVNTVLSGAASGATMGMLSGNPMGAAIGAGVGLASGGIQAATQYFEKEDDEFRSVRESEYNRLKQEEQQDLTAGTGLAAQRQVDQIAFSSLMGGAGTAETFLNGIKDMANETPFLYEDLKSMSKVLSTYGYNPDEIQKKLQQIGDTGANLGLDQSNMSMVATYLGRMNSTDKTTMEYLNPLMERGIPALDYLSESLGKSKAEITDMVSKGLVPGSEAAKIIADSMGKANAGAMQRMSQTYNGLKSTVEGLEQERQAAMGEGYTTERSKGLREQTVWLDKNNEELSEANRLIGVYQANLENTRDAEIRKAEEAALAEYQKKKAESDAEINARSDLKEYEKQAMRNEREIELGAECGRLISKAKEDAEIAYRNTEAYQLQEATETQLINDLGVALKDDYWRFGRNLRIEMNKGLASVSSLKELSPSWIYNNTARFGTSVESLTNGEYADSVLNGDKSSTDAPGGSAWNTGIGQRSAALGKPPGHAYGISYVPYNGFISELHEGERVLTAQENRGYSTKNNTSTVTITGNSFIVREEADIEAIARKIAERVARAADLM